MSEPIRYQAGRHVVEMAGKVGRWTVAVDGVKLERSFPSLADAWTAGVTEASRVDSRETPSLEVGSSMVQFGLAV